jgi:hypothetical protein
MNEASWRRLLGQIRDGFVVPIAGCQLLVDADGKSSLQAKVAQQVLSNHGQDPGDPPLPPFHELNEAVTRLRRSGANLQELYGDVDDAIRKVTTSDDFVIPTPIRLLSGITDFRLFVTLTPDDLLLCSLRSRCAVNEIIHAPKLPTSHRRDLPLDWMSRPGEVQLLYLLGKSSSTPTFAILDRIFLSMRTT